MRSLALAFSLALAACGGVSDPGATTSDKGFEGPLDFLADEKDRNPFEPGERFGMPADLRLVEGDAGGLVGTGGIFRQVVAGGGIGPTAAAAPGGRSAVVACDRRAGAGGVGGRSRDPARA